MIYVKSILAGLLALIVAPVCRLVIVVVNPMLWSIPLLIFFIGFIWEYRRLAKCH
jgi:hypothetical protein